MTESKTIPELRRDILAQIRCLLDPSHPKKAVYIADPFFEVEFRQKSDEPVFRSNQASGIFLTTDFGLWKWFNGLDAPTDEDMARALGYPESKSQIADRADGVMAVQARDVNDCVVFEACCSDRGRGTTIEAVKRQVPIGGRLVFTTLAAIIQRRLAET